MAPALGACLMLGATARGEEAAAEMLSIRQPGLHFFSGEQAARTVLIRAAGLEGAPATRLTWTVTVGTAVAQRGSAQVKPGGGLIEQEILLQMPEVRRVTAGALRLSLQQDARVLRSRAYDIGLFPPAPVVPAMVKDKKIVLYDPTGRTAAALAYLGVKYAELPQTWSLDTGEADLLIVGCAVPDEVLARLLDQVRANVHKGMAVLCLEQAHLDEGKPPYLALADREAPLAAWAEPAGKQPVRGELPEAMLSLWRGDGAVVRRAFAGPTRGNFRILTDAAPAGVADAPQAAVVEAPSGKGKLVFSQMLIGEKFLEEPVARYAFVNLLVRALAPGEPLGAKAAVLAGPEDEAKKVAETAKLLGLDAVVNPLSVEGYDFVLVSGTEGSAERLGASGRAGKEALLGVLKEGGTVSLVGLAPGAVGTFDFLWGGAVTVAAAEEGAALDLSSMADKALFQGLRPSELRTLCGRAPHPLIAFTSQAPNVASVAGAGIVALPRLKGTVIISQLPLPEDEKDEMSLRTYSELLTNSGVELKIPERRDE